MKYFDGELAKNAGQGVFRNMVSERVEKAIAETHPKNLEQTNVVFRFMLNAVLSLPPTVRELAFLTAAEAITHHKGIPAPVKGFFAGVLEAVPAGINRMLENPAVKAEDIENETHRILAEKSAKENSMSTETETKTEEKVPASAKLADVLTEEQLIAFSGLKWAIERAIDFDPKAQGPEIEEWYNTLDGKANHLFRAWNKVAKENPEVFAKYLPKEKCSFEEVRDNPMRYGKELFAVLLTMVPPTREDRLWDGIDLMIPVPEWKKWLKEHIKDGSKNFLYLILAVIGVLLVLLLGAAGLWIGYALGTLALFVVSAAGYLYGLFTWHQNYVTAAWALNLGMAGVYVARLFFTPLGKWLGFATGAFWGRKEGGDGLVYRGIWKFRRLVETFGFPLPGEIGQDPKEGKETVRDNGWFYNTATSVTIVALGVAVAFNVITLAFNPGWYGLASQGPLAFFWLVALYTDYSGRNHWRYTDEEHKTHRTKIRDGLEQNMFWGLRIGAIGIAAAVVVAFVSATLPFIGVLSKGTVEVATAKSEELVARVKGGSDRELGSQRTGLPEAVITFPASERVQVNVVPQQAPSASASKLSPAEEARRLELRKKFGLD